MTLFLLVAKLVLLSILTAGLMRRNDTSQVVTREWNQIKSRAICFNG